MGGITRRGLIVAGGATLGLAACGNGIGSGGATQIDARVAESERFLVSRFPGTQGLIDRAAGVLWVPLMTEAALGLGGGAFGRGALKIKGATVDYYSAVQAQFGLQIGAQQYSHALFFMTDAALADFRSARGWALGADAKFASPEGGASFGADSTTTLDPVQALVFGQAGLIAGAAIEGIKYTRIIP
jgi:lipid-binding SYLF domain-containing protein